MAYGPLAQCAFMSGPSPFKKKAAVVIRLLLLTSLLRCLFGRKSEA